MMEKLSRQLNDQELAQWVVQTCLMFGATVATAYQVAGLFVAGVRPTVPTRATEEQTQ